MKYTVIFEKGPTSWGAWVPDLPGCIAVGESREEADRLIRQAITGHVQALREFDIPVPAPAHVSAEVDVPAA